MALKLIKTDRWGNTDGYGLDVSALEAGDKVVMVHSGRLTTAASATVYTVARRTRTQVICEGPTWQKEFKFRAEDGTPVGDSHYNALRAPFDPEVLDALETMRLTQYHRDHGRLLATKVICHDGRHNLMSDAIDLATQARRDLVEIRSAQHEWNAQKGLADAVR